MKTKITIFVIILLTYLFSTHQAFANNFVKNRDAGHSAILSASASANQSVDTRAAALKSYLSKYDKTLASEAQTMVDEADKYHLDWTLLAAISGVESTYGEQIPGPNCPNAWGYGIYGDHMTCFTSYKEGIHTISQALREQYMDKWGAKDVYAIGRLYAASPTWAERVDRNMHEIATYSFDYQNKALPISL